MIRNYIKAAWRNITRNKIFSFINIFGLSIGLATCMLIMFYIFDENSHDKQHVDGDRIFRVASVSENKNKKETWAATAAPLAEAFAANLPEVQTAARLMTFPDIATMLLTATEGNTKKSFFETRGYYVDSSFFQLFTYKFLYGNSATALNQVNNIVISDVLSAKFFGKENPVGKVIIVKTPFGNANYTVKAVFNSNESKSHIPASYFLSMHNNDMWNWVQRQTSWTSNNIFFTYIKIKNGVNALSFEKKLTHFYESHTADELKSAGYTKSLFLQPLKEIYLRSTTDNEIADHGNINFLYILGSIGIFILLIACINFMNLSTARSQKRAREVGVRKVMGAAKTSLIGQFLAESFFMCMLAFIIALLLLWMVLPAFNHFTQKNILPVANPSILFAVAALAAITGLLAGLYPAVYLSSFKPVTVLKGKILNSFSAIAIRKGLVVFQFTISICLILGAIVMWKQLALLQNQQLGFQKEQQLILPMQAGYKNSEKDYEPLKNELAKIPGIKIISSGSAYPGVPNLNDMLFYPEAKTVKDVVDVHLAAVNNGYMETLGFTLLSGRFFSQAIRDSAGIILNEEAVKSLGYTVAEAPGKKIQYDYAGHKTMEIVGVVKNFNFESLHTEIKPYGFTTETFGNKYGNLIASITTTNYAGLLQSVEKVWTKLNPDVPFLYSFLDQDFQRNYQKEQYASNIIAGFTAIAIVIACLGLFGLAAFSAEQRTKEIGVRKVLGASVGNVTLMLSGDFIKLVLLAMIIASPIAWFGMNKWLQDFAYRIHISWWMFVLAGALAVFIALLTVGLQAVKAAMANPVKSLRTE